MYASPNFHNYQLLANPISSIPSHTFSPLDYFEENARHHIISSVNT